MKSIVFFILLAITVPVSAQTYRDSIVYYRQLYVKEMQEDKRSPIKPGDVKYMHFFEPDHNYCVWADITLTPGSKPFLINTHSGKQKPFKEYGVITFTIHDTVQTLHVYQSVNLLNDQANKDELFIPFTDFTNYELTFAGGRYLDVSVKNIVNNRILIDFNKCYNPYCAFAEGYSCPIPPQENALHIAVLAGEKMFSKNLGY